MVENKKVPCNWNFIRLDLVWELLKKVWGGNRKAYGKFYGIYKIQFLVLSLNHDYCSSHHFRKTNKF